jgi:hypothetical protein
MEFNKIFVVIFSSFLQNFLHALRAFFKIPAHLSLSSKSFRFLRFLQKRASCAFLKIFPLLALLQKPYASCASSKALRISPFPQNLCTLIQNLCTCLKTSMLLAAQLLKSAAAKVHAVPDIWCLSSGTICLSKGKSMHLLFSLANPAVVSRQSSL